MANIPIVDPSLADVPPKIVTITIRGDSINLDIPPGVPMDVVWGWLHRTARVLECEMQAARVFERVMEGNVRHPNQLRV